MATKAEGDVLNLRTTTRVQHCEHSYVAMHKNRGAFPLEDAHQESRLPVNVREEEKESLREDG